MLRDRRRDLALESWGYKQREYLEKCCLTINTHNNQLITTGNTFIVFFFDTIFFIKILQSKFQKETHAHTGILLLLTRLHVLARVTNGDTLLINLLFQMNSDCHKRKTHEQSNDLKLMFFFCSYTLIRTWDCLLTLGGASSEPPMSQDTGTCLLISIRLRSSCWAFSSARIVLHKQRWKALSNNNILLLELQFLNMDTERVGQKSHLYKCDWQMFPKILL